MRDSRQSCDNFLPDFRHLRPEKWRVTLASVCQRFALSKQDFRQIPQQAGA
jgi:hypothetical protein